MKDHHIEEQYAKTSWQASIDLPAFEQLNEDLHVDVVIVGGGITGITAAYLLVQAGMKVALLEAGKLLNGTTGHTTAKITAQHGLIYDELIHFGKSKARLYYEANTEAMNFIQNTIDHYQINCDFSRQDAYIYATTHQYRKKIEKEAEAYEQLNIEGDLVHDLPFNIDVENALVMKNQAQFHPLKYLAHLVKVITDKGGLIFEHTVAEHVERGEEATVLTRGGPRVTGGHILSCSHFPFYEGVGFYFTRMYADRSYVVAAKTKSEYPGGMYLSVDQPSRSLRSMVIDGEERVLITGESHKTGQGGDTLKHYQALETFGEDVLGIDKLITRWSTQDLTTIDKLPYIGPLTSWPSQQNILVATGYRKWGMTNGTAAAQLLAKLVLKKKSRFEDVFTPSRFYADPSLKKFFQENLNVAKHLIEGKTDTTHKEINDLSEDEGAVVRIDGKRKGAYKDKEGELHVVDTTCTHMGCEVNWNDGDRTWDCPCHGSRFSYTGEVVEGPAEKPLQKVDHNMLESFIGEKSGY
ncbi:glycine/D-amino acid oxidase-like deaminating enzyme/nitrite reductase/ring-hydroxylating ferredoxin subunit [Geomicrobium halophilum]|uniref:Glycine/D-amino acid oxidase-like deaminating enzyme/nitrite reductase/ring-hydroxylating ferredoxin subunit n=1 Tax=Geomicrobium halophilum TaxID=549000 RepID=A0A841PZR3_9BACL|nr:FAD-dependent oxidoreductase [Geomicrobium halophilum]MBB6448288.1 glycine/D-amino acid oxidase-like deaminating enzyme/nitrite reductase/ring-hydroxylating ferredoxin subunit [Geomicrobium halophilum]